MSQEKYIGMDVHQATISAAVMDVHGRLLMESVLETKASTITEFIQGLRFEQIVQPSCRSAFLKSQEQRSLSADW